MFGKSKTQAAWGVFWLGLTTANGLSAQPAGTEASVAAASPQVIAAQQLYATVNGKPVTQGEFHAAYSNYLRQSFYHGQVPQEQLTKARKEVDEQITNRILLLEEIERRGIQADTEDVEKQIEVYERRYAGNPNWLKNRETMLPGVRQQLGLQSRYKLLEMTVKDLPTPAQDEVKAYYTAKPELFTEPEKLRVHSILLAVDPSSARAVWDAAHREADGIVRRIRGGADFADQARLFSNDQSAEKGGDMGYLHQGMIPDALQEKIGKFKLGEVGEPIEMLQGVGIFRLDERVPARLQPFENVVERARDLLLRERREQAWKDLLAKLRSEAKIVSFEAAASPPGAKQ